MSKPVTVAIVGGGLASPVLALCLLKHAPLLKPTIYELRDADAPAEEGNVALAPNALRVLDYIGIYTRIAAQGYNYEDLSFVNERLQVFGTMWNGSEKEYNFKALRIRRHLVRDALVEECQKRDIEIKFGMRCIGIEHETDTGATVAFQNGEKVEADFVVGADGIHSHIRDFIAKDCKPVFSGMHGIGGTINRKALPSQINQMPLPCFVMAQEGMFAMMPTTPAGDEIGFFVTTFRPDRSRAEWDALSRDKDELSRMLKQHCHGNFPELIKGIPEQTSPKALTSWPHFQVPTLESYVSPIHHRVILIGDAAHAIPPTGGQGAAMAMEDAQTLAYALARCATPANNQSQADVLSKWERQRLARIRDVYAFTRRGGDSRKSSAGWVSSSIKEWGMWAVFMWWGPSGGLGWLYSYRAESILGAMRE